MHALAYIRVHSFIRSFIHHYYYYRGSRERVRKRENVTKQFTVLLLLLAGWRDGISI